MKIKELEPYLFYAAGAPSTYLYPCMYAVQGPSDKRYIPPRSREGSTAAIVGPGGSAACRSAHWPRSRKTIPSRCVCSHPLKVAETVH